MYDELVKRLRELPPEDFCDEWEFACACQQIMHEAADAIEKLTGRNVGKWIPVTERLPRVGEEVLIYLWDNPSAYIAWIDKDGQWATNDFCVGDDYLPTAWMPLPEPPKGD